MKKKLLLAFLPLSLIPLLGAGWISFILAKKAFTDQVLNHIESIAAIEQGRIESFVDHNLQQLSLITIRSSLRTSLESYLQTRENRYLRDMNETLADTSDSLPASRNLSVLSLDGIVLASSDLTTIGQKHPNMAPLLSAQQGNRFDIFFVNDTDKPKAFLYGPVYRHGRLLGLLAVQHNLEDFIAWLKDRPELGETAEIQLARRDQNGDALFLTPFAYQSRSAMKRTVPKSEDSARQFLSGRRLLSGVEDQRGVRVIAATRYLPKMDWVLIVKQDEAEAFGSIIKLRNIFILVFLALTGAILLISKIMARSLIEPILHLRWVAERIRDGDLTHRAKIETKDEIGTLAQAINQMAESLIQAKQDLERKVEERTKELARSEVQLKNSNVFLDSIVENIPDMIFVKDAKELRFVRFNKAGEQLLGYKREELLGKNDYDFFPKQEADFFTNKDREVLADDNILSTEEPIHTKDQGVRLLHTKKIPIRDANGRPRYLLGISEDITVRKQAEQELLDKQRELARANVEKEQLELFAYVAAHDLQEPLHKIVSFGDLLNERVALEGSGRDYLERMQAAARRMSRLIDDLLRFARVTAKEDAYEPVDLKALVNDVLSDLELRIVQADATIEVGDLPVIRASRIQLRELFQNLIANALKFRNTQTKPKISVEGGVAGSGEVEIIVRDNGIGFDDKFKERIFRPFERLHGRREFDGSGIGLAICQKIVERHGGRITAHGVLGEGATFVITLPAAAAVAEEQYANV